MKRRGFLFGGLLPVFASAATSATPPWRAEVVNGGFDGTHHIAGLRVTLDSGWKTYWRVPGAGGIPPNISLSGGNLMSFEVLYPTPRRFRDESGESLGYKDEVVFPLLVKTSDPLASAELTLSAFLGVCQTVCIPVPFEQRFSLASDTTDAGNLSLLRQWIDRCPKLVGDTLVKSLSVREADGGIFLAALADQVFDEVFVEFVSGKPFFAEQPAKTADGFSMRLLGAKVLADVHGQKVRLTLVKAGKALEQTLVIA
jgi:DsbC/DsbD-like thiol-disulfide interchange protein